MPRLLTFNCHEAYVHLLGKLGEPLDVVDGLPGRHVARWDERMRPVPEGARLIRLEQALARPQYDVAIAHNLSDLLALRSLALPKILVLHVDLRARVHEEPGPHDLGAMQRQVQDYLAAIGGIAVAVSKTKADSWGQACSVIPPGVDPGEYSGYAGTLPVALRVANQVLVRRDRFAWDAHEALTSGLACSLVGHNPGLPGVEPARSWDDLRQRYREHRAYVHTAGVGLDDGYNLGVVEAMMTGMPVVSLALPESPVVDGENGYVSTDRSYLRERLCALLADRALALRLGARARERALELFHIDRFVQRWLEAIELARRAFFARAR